MTQKVIKWFTNIYEAGKDYIHTLLYNILLPVDAAVKWSPRHEVIDNNGRVTIGRLSGTDAGLSFADIARKVNAFKVVDRRQMG